jgi:hypothetical protein
MPSSPCAAEDDCRFDFRVADRIEELEAKLATCEKYRDAYAEMERIGAEAYRDLEANLAKAEHIVRILASAEWDDRLGEAVDLACAYLAEVDEG